MYNVILSFCLAVVVIVLCMLFVSLVRFIKAKNKLRQLFIDDHNVTFKEAQLLAYLADGETVAIAMAGKITYEELAAHVVHTNYLRLPASLQAKFDKRYKEDNNGKE